jgi:hypothetical protein
LLLATQSGRVITPEVTHIGVTKLMHFS